MNDSLPWNIDFFEKYIDKWDWRGLSMNDSLPWNIDFFEKYIDKWDWYELSHNESVPWSIELIEKYIDKWEFRSNRELYEKVLNPFLTDEFIDEIMSEIVKQEQVA